MCIVSPGRVLAVDPEGATVDLDGRTRRASTVLLPDVVAGDQVLVAAGTVIRRLEPAEAADLIALLALARGDAGATTRRTPS
jgi:hydrogenase assembly chaperone HypC/HupF